MEYTATSYKFTVINDYGSIDFTINISIYGTNEPIILKSVSEHKFYVGETVESLFLIDVIGPDLHFYTEPSIFIYLLALPSSLTMDEKTGLISGSTIFTFEEQYNFIVENNFGDIRSSITLKSIMADELTLIDANKNITLYTGVKYSNYQLFTVLGSDIQYYVTPDLPEELTISSNTGKLNGYFLNTFKTNTYTFICTKGNKETKIIIDIVGESTTVPIIISYEKSLKSQINMLEDKNSPSYSLFLIAGDEISYTVYPDLPKGIKLDNSTGIITGYPLETEHRRLYSFSFENNFGSVDLLLLLSFPEPDNLVIVKSVNNIELYKDDMLEYLHIATIAGENMNEYNIYPSLPLGLFLSRDDYEYSIYGLPIKKNNKTMYTLTASNEISFVVVNFCISVDGIIILI